MNFHRSYIPSLEGVRGYLFLLVFAVHFTGHSWNLNEHSAAAAPWMLLCQLSFVTVPAFFALSGYLITGILLDTRERPGFFRIFYARRALRVLPLYYAVLAVVALAALAFGAHLLPRHALFLVYLNNLWPGVSIYQLTPRIFIGHLWSLAVEEQFYLIWPVVIWFVRSRRALLALCYGAVALMFVSRFAAVGLHLDPGSLYQNTWLRADPIMLGAALAIHHRDPDFQLGQLLQPAWFVMLAGTMLIVVRALVYGQGLPYDDFGIRYIMPTHGLMGAALLVLVLHPETVLARLCSRDLAVYLGKRSYSLYVLHQLFAPFCLLTAVPWMSRHIGNVGAHLLVPVAALGVVYGLGELCFRYIEMPCMEMKKHFRYRDAVKPRLSPRPTIVPSPVAILRVPWQRRLQQDAA